MLYAAALSAKFTEIDKKAHSVITYVLYPANVKPPSNIYLGDGSLRFSVIQILLGDLINGDEMLAKVSHEFAENPDLVLTEENLLKFVLAPLGKVKGDSKEFSRQIITLAKSLFPWPDQKKSLTLVIFAASSFLDNKELTAIVGEDVMNQLAQDLFGDFFSARLEEVRRAEQAKFEEALRAEKAKAEAEKARAEAEKARADKLESIISGF
jgi:hypothetical protein